MDVNITITEITASAEIQETVINCTVSFDVGGGGSGDVTKAYVDQQDNLRVLKVAGQGLISDAEKSRLALVFNYDDTAVLEALDDKVDKVENYSLVPDESINALWYRYAGSCLVPSITDNLDGTVTLGDGSFCTYRNAEGKGIIDQYEYEGQMFAMVNGVMNYIIGDYNGGNPIVRVTQVIGEINETTIVPIYSIFRTNNILHIQHWDSLAAALSNKIHKSIVKTQRYRRQEGLMLSQFGTRNLALTAGIVYVGAVEYPLSAIDSTIDNIFQFTQNNLGVWVLTLVTQYNNTQYNTPTGLVELTANRYAVNWIFRGVENPKHMYCVLGVGDYTLTQAQEASVPTIPINISSHAVLVSKIVVQKGSNAGVIRSAFDTSISFSQVTEHNNTTGIQGGAVGEYYHLAASQVDIVNGVITELPAQIGAATYPIGRELSITGVLPNGVSSTLTIPTPILLGRNQSVVHFATNAIAAPSFTYSGFSPIWGGGEALAMVVNKRYTIVFKQIYNGTAWVVLANWGDY